MFTLEGSLMQPFREPLVTVCRCCQQPLRNLGWQPGPIMRPEMGAYWVECADADCTLGGVTASDVSYEHTTDQYLE